MKISPYLNIDRIEFTVTYFCTGRCAHCSVGDMLGRRIGGHAHVRTEDASKAVSRLAQLFDIRSIMTFGGEPLLYPETVCAIHDTARACSIGKRQLITNGYFSKDAERIRSVAESLAQSGVNDTLLSVDAFHQHTIPLEPVRTFAESCINSDSLGLRLSPAWVVNREHENVYNAQTREILCGFADLNIPVSEGNDIFMAGRAAENLAHFYPPARLDYSEKCGTRPYTEPLTNVTSISIVPNGDVVICSFVIGNIYEEDIGTIVSRYDPYENEYMRAILTGGARELISTAKRRGIDLDPAGCYSICDLCNKINKK